MGEAEREKLEAQVIGEISEVDCQLEYDENVDGSREVVDGWIMPVLELNRIKEARNAIVLESHDYYTVEENEGFQPIHPLQLR
jgi:midasin